MGLSNRPSAGGDRHARAFERLGWSRDRQTKGKNPHIIMVKAGHRATLSIPVHKGRDVSRALIAGLLRSAGISEADYVKAFKGK